MFFLNQNEIQQLNKIKNAVHGGRSFSSILELCNEANCTIDDKGFPYTYAGCLLASHERVDDARQMFSMNLQDTFSSILNDYLADVGALVPAGQVFKSAAPYDIYVQTAFFQKHQGNAIRNISESLSHAPPPTSDTPITIIDIGPGNGALIAEIVNQLALLYNIDYLELVLIDPFEDMLNKAGEYCKQNVAMKTKIINICCKIQEINEEQINVINQLKPIWFVNAALSVHHMPREVKIPMLKQLKTFSPNFILTEVNWNHDLPEKDSPELIYSVVKNYGIFCEDIFKLQVSEEDKKLCLYHFPLSEAINIIKQDRPNRIDYHTPIDEWKKIGKEAGYSTGNAMPTYSIDNDTFAFTMKFTADPV